MNSNVKEKLPFRLLLWKALNRWIDDEASMMGAALAYYTIFSIAPLILIAIGIAGLIFGDDAARGEAFYNIRRFIGDDGGKAIEEMLKQTWRSGNDLWATILGVITLLIGSSTVFVSLQASFNRIWRVPLEVSAGWRGFLRDRLISFAMVLTIGFLLLTSLVLSAVLSAAGKFLTDGLPGGEAIWQMLNWAISFSFVALLFATIYRYLPDARTPWRPVITAGFVASALFSVGQLAIGLYLGKTSVASTFGAAGSVIILLIWTYYSAQILLFGAEFAWVYAEDRGFKPIVRRKPKTA